MNEDALWRIDTACRNGWPTPHETEWKGWLFRHGGGGRRRVNAVSPLRGPRANPVDTVAAADAFYQERGAPHLYYVPSIANEMDAHLDVCGFSVAGHTKTLVASLSDNTAARHHQDIGITSIPSDEWLEAHFQLGGTPESHQNAFRETIGALANPAAFADSRSNGEIAAQAYAVIHSGFLVIEAVATAPAHRRRGLSRRVLGSLLAWGHQQGVEEACLQVLADNTPACALYRQLGFGCEAYRYHYRVPPKSRWSPART